MLGFKSLKEGKLSERKFCDIFDIKKDDINGFISSRGDIVDIDYESEIELNYS